MGKGKCVWREGERTERKKTGREETQKERGREEKHIEENKKIIWLYREEPLGVVCVFTTVW